MIRECLGFPFHLNLTDGYSPIFRVSKDAFHAVVADFSGIQIAAVTFSAFDAFPIVEQARMLISHDESLLRPDYYTSFPRIR